MKRFVLFLFGMFFYASVFAENINLNFYVDGNIQQTNVSSCSVGSEFTLPSAPSKPGYDFVGWAEFFYRGTFSDWASVPNTTTGYLSDIHNNQTPQQYDYIIVNDSSGIPRFGKKIVIEVSTTQYGLHWTGFCRTYMNDGEFNCDNANTTDGSLTIENGVFNSVWSTRFTSPTKTVYYKGVAYAPGTPFLTLRKHPDNNGTYFAYFVEDYPYSGKWMCRYNGNWSDNLKGGWIPEKQIND